MGLPSLSGIPRMGADLTRYEIKHPLLDEPLVVWLRPLLRIEKDALEERVKKFVARHVDGGWEHDATGEWMKEPDLIRDETGQPVPMSANVARMMLRYEAMQTPMVGKSRPAGQDIVGVDYMVQLSIKLDEAWGDLQTVAAIEWAKGDSGEAWGRPGS